MTPDAEDLAMLRAEFVQGFFQDMQDAVLGKGFPPVTLDQAREAMEKVEKEEKKYQAMIGFIGEVIFREPNKKRIVMNNEDLRLLQYIAQRAQSTVAYTGRKNKKGRTLDGVPIIIDDNAEKPRLE